MRFDKAFDMDRVIPVVSIEISDRVKSVGIRENAANGARRITQVRIRLRQDYVHSVRLFIKLRLGIAVGN
jgi:hypothetical protein